MTNISLQERALIKPSLFNARREQPRAKHEEI